MIPGNGPAAPGSADTGLAQITSNPSITQTRTALKRHRVIRALLDGPLHRFQAEKFPISDHALPSTISELKRDGLKIDARRIRLAGYGGRPAYLAEYRLAPESRHRALQMLGVPHGTQP